LLIPANAPISIVLAICYVLLTSARYWAIGTLGRFWTHRIITLKDAPIVRSGPYAFVRHPNYVVTIAETFLLPAVFGAWAVAFIMTAVWAAVLSYKIELEDAALAARRQPMLEQTG
jgi:methyltransferase